MKPVDQTRFGMGDFKADPIVAPGDCYSASLASLLECELDDLPDEQALIPKWKAQNKKLDDHKDSWAWYWVRLQDWLAAFRGLMMLDVKPDQQISNTTSFFALAGGVGPRGLNHSIVVEIGSDPEGAHPIGDLWTPAHDPHPSRAYLGGAQPFDFTLLVNVVPHID